MLLEIRHISGSGFHFGRHGLGQEESGVQLPSDSLFAAMVARLAALYGPQLVDQWIQPFLQNDPPFVLSSVFPRVGNVLLFPTPLRGSRAQDKESVSPKILKKVDYVSESIFRQLLDGKSLVELYDETCLLQDGHALYTRDERSQLPRELRASGAGLWHVEQRPRVTIGRERQSSTLYFTGRTSFSPDCGLWFAVRRESGHDEDQQIPDQLLEDLQYAGLGGERASGFGQFRITPGGILDFPAPEGQPVLLLSRWHPRPDETTAMLDPRAAYKIDTVGGWVESPGNPAERRRSLRMLVEGSVIGPLHGPISGQLVDVQPDYGEKRPLGHPVWRNGQALAVGFAPGALEENLA